MCDTVTIENQLGNVLHIKFSYPRENPDDYVKNISDALYYTGVLDGIVKSPTLTSQENDAVKKSMSI